MQTQIQFTSKICANGLPPNFPDTIISNLNTQALSNAARIVYAPIPPCSDIRTSSAVLTVSVYIIAKQLLESGRLDSFGLPMTSLALSSVLGLAAASKNLHITRQAQRIASEERLPSVISSGPPIPTVAPQNQAIGLRNLSSALGLAGSFGLFTNWALARQSHENPAPWENMLVPVTFANSAVFKLLANSSSISPAAMPYAKSIVLTSMLIGSALFQNIALKQHGDKSLFAISSLLTLGLLPQTLYSFSELFQTLRTMASREQNEG